jgi:hypothetical protein
VTTGYSSTNDTRHALPGDNVKWDNRLVQNGPTITNKNIAFWPVQSGTYTGSTTWGTGTGATGGKQTLKSGAGKGSTSYNGNTYWSPSTHWTRKITQDDVNIGDGAKVGYYCMTLNAQPQAYVNMTLNNDVINSGQHCVDVVPHYPTNCTPGSCCDGGTCGGGGGCVGDSCNGGGCTGSNCGGNSCPGGNCQSGGMMPQTTLGGSGSSVTIGDTNTAKFNYKVKNMGPTKSLPTTYWAYAFILKQGEKLTFPDGPIDYNNLASAGCGARNVGTSQTTYCHEVDSKSGLVVGSEKAGDPLGAIGSYVNMGSFTVNLSKSEWDAEPGDKICSYVVINPFSVSYGVVKPTTAAVSASNIECYVIAQKPQLQLRGSDSASGATKFGNTTVTGNPTTGFYGSYSNQAPRGSWSQYGLLVYSQNGLISKFGSAGSTIYTSNSKVTCQLWFSNTYANTATASPGDTHACDNSSPTAGQTGALFKSLPDAVREIQLPDSAKLTPAQIRSAIAAGTLKQPTYFTSATCSVGAKCFGLWTNANGEYGIDGDVELLNSTDDTIGGTGKKQTFVISGNLYITDNIYSNKQDDKYAKLLNMPNVNIIANNIYISSNVKYIYGTYIARNQISTCGQIQGNGAPLAKFKLDASGNATEQTADCYNQLQVDGALVSLKSPVFQRTIGGGRGADIKTASEIINYTPNLWLVPWYINSGQDETPSDWVITGETNLPARW